MRSFFQNKHWKQKEVSHKQKPLTLQASLSTKATMEFLKRVAAVRGRLVTSVMLSWPSGHISFRTGLELRQRHRKRRKGGKALGKGEKKLIYALNPVTKLSKTVSDERSWHLLYMRRLKSWKSRSLFVSKKPSTEYLQQTEKFRALLRVTGSF